MIVRTIMLSAALLALGPDAQAGEASRLLHKVSCSVVRYYVSRYSATAAESWARSHGATDAQIEAARHCLKLPAQDIEAARLSGQ
jgi:hypothetical protein